MSPRDRLFQELERQAEQEEPGGMPVVSPELFFTGNTDWGSMGCNLIDHPSPAGFHRLLALIEARPDVQAVLIEVSEADEDEPWPFSERLYVLTEAEPEDVEDWLRPLQPGEVTVGWAGAAPGAAPELELGHQVIAAWWD